MGNAKIAKIVLPSAYRDNFRVSYTKEYAGIIGVKTDEFYFISYKIDNFNRNCEVNQEISGSTSGISVCGSCSVAGDENDDFVIGG